MTKPAPRRPLALTIAGSDSGGGAGIQTDLRTFAALGVHGTSAITAVTAQNTRAVTRIAMLPAAMIEAQVDAVLDDFAVGAIKTGMLGSARSVRAVCAALDRHPARPLVVDPVLVATSGAQLAREGLVGAILRRLLPRATLLTPNLPEAARLLGRELATRDDLRDAGLRLRDAGAFAVLVKGGHLPGRSVHDVLVTPAGTQWFRHPRLTGESHGTGCTLAAAITARLACGAPLEEAVADAIDFVHRAIAHGFRPGKGGLTVLDPLAAAGR